MAEKQKNEWEGREIGALWVKESKNDNKKFMTGTVNGVEVVIFPNKFKEKGDNKPSYRVYKGEETGGKPKKQSKPEVEDDDDLPL